MSNENRFADLSDEQLMILHSISEAFESDLRSEKPARIESFLDQVPAELKTDVFCDLFAIELEWRRMHATRPDASEYLHRFPEFQDHISQLLKAETQRTISDSSSQRTKKVDSAISGQSVLTLASGCMIDNRYEIVELIGEGGMGSVYLADQREPVTRQVAIKFIKGGMDSKAVQARFDIERQALALMDHPGIARVFDGGQTASGLPYFVMELVSGEPITRFCDDQCLDLKARLQLFVSVCYAVQHAHSKGIIHRDLKPGNILVTEADGRPRPKVIDFGVAKAIDQKLTEHSLAATVMIVGTPAYMSPEQADPASMDIDIRTDVYALGIILYELLAGTPPLDADSLPRGNVLEMLRRIREVDSPRPSTKVKSSGSLSKIAANRSIDPQKLGPMLRGELDWIALKAIEKDRNRRYATVSGLQQDIERYLAGEMVEARPPSRSYRLQKFVRRNRLQVAAASLIAVSLIAGIFGTSWGMLKARMLEQTARSELVIKEAALESEERERKFAEAISDFVENDFLALTSLEGRLDFDDQNTGLTKDSTLRDLLDRAAKKLNTRKDLDPRIEARLRWIIGKSYRNLGAFQDAVESYGRSVTLNTEVFGKDHLATLQAQAGLANAWQDNGQLELAQALLLDVVARMTRLLGSEDDRVLDSMRVLAENHRRLGQPAKAIAVLEETLAGLKSLYGPNDRIVLSNMYALALALNDADQQDKALTLLEQTLALQTEHLAADHPDISTCSGKLAEMYCKFGQFQKAKPLLEKVLEWSIAQHGPEGHVTIYTMSRLGGLYRNLGQLDKALPLAEQNVALARKVFGNEHPNVTNAISDLAMTYRANGEHAKALPLFEESMERRKASNGVKHPDTVLSMLNLASSLKSNGKLDMAEQLNVECLAIATEVLGENHTTTMTIKQNLAAGYWSAKKLDLSVPLFEEVLEYREGKYGRSHPDTLMAVANVGVNYRDAGRLEEAIPLLEEAYSASQNLPALSFMGAELLDGYLRAGKTEQGLKLLEELVAVARSNFPADSLKLATPLAYMGKLLLRSNLLDEAERVLRETEMIRQQQEPDMWRTFETKLMLGETLLKKQNYIEAEPFLTSAYEGMTKLPEGAPKNVDERRNVVVGLLVDLATSTNRPDDVAKWELLRVKALEPNSRN